MPILEGAPDWALLIPLPDRVIINPLSLEFENSVGSTNRWLENVDLKIVGFNHRQTSVSMVLTATPYSVL